MDIIIGIAGALIGGFIMRMFGFLGKGGMIYTILVATGGAVLLTWIVRLSKKQWALSHRNQPVVRFYNKPGNVEQWIKKRDWRNTRETLGYCCGKLHI